MAKISFIWDAVKSRFMKSVGGILSLVRKSDILNLRNAHGATKAGIIDTLSKGLMAGDISIQEWVLGFRRTLKQSYIQQYLLGRGGRNVMTQADWGRLGGILQRQYGFMQNFAKDIIDGKLSPAQVNARMKLYFESSTQAFERAKVAAIGLTLPQYPGDGRTQCRSNCKCEWDIHETEATWECYWRLNPAEHCDDCLNNAATYNPYVVDKRWTN